MTFSFPFPQTFRQLVLSKAMERRVAYSHRELEREHSVGTKRRVVSLDSIDSRDSYSAFTDSKPRSHSAGASTTAALNGGVMNPLMFEEVDLKNTPLSSLRSCSEFQKFQKISSNSSWLGRGDRAFESTKLSMASYLASFFRSTKKPVGSNTQNDGTSGLKKKTLKGINDDERSFFVESMTKRDVDDGVCVPPKRISKSNSTVTGSFPSSSAPSSSSSSQYHSHTSIGASGAPSSSSSSSSYSRPRASSPGFNQSMSVSAHSHSGMLPSLICLPRVSFTSGSSFSSRPGNQVHRKSIEEVAREENTARVMRRKASYDRGNSLFYESTAALDMLFGFRSSFDGQPMEIELKTIRKFGNEVQFVSSGEFENQSGLIDTGLNEGDLLPGIIYESRGGMPRSNLSGRMDVGSFVYDRNNVSPNNDMYARDRRQFPTNQGSANHSHVHLDRIIFTNDEISLARCYSVLKDRSLWRPAINEMLTILPRHCRQRMSGPEDDAFYEQLRIQPFGFGAYLRGMLWAGFSSLFFNSYSLILWPTLPGLSPMKRTVASLLYIYLFFQFLLNMVQLPLRISLHLKCWESSRTVDVEASLATLRMMLHSDVWVMNRFIGRCQDFLAAGFLVFGEIYLQFGNNISHNDGDSSSTDPLNAIIISVCASTLLSLLMRVVVATAFSLSCHDPAILSEARKRGLSKLDIDVLPAFVFTNLEEVNNQDCSICLCDFDMGEMLISLPCGKKHSFHANCIRQWLERQNSCPLCQRIV